MKKFLKAALISALALISFIGFNATNVKADQNPRIFVHTLQQAPLYSQSGLAGYDKGMPYFNFNVLDKELPQYSDWLTGSTLSGSNTSYTEVGDNEFVDNKDVALVNQYGSSNIQTMNTTTPKAIYSLDSKTYGIKNTGKALDSGAWLCSSHVRYPNGDVYYQVATNEWININA